MSLVTRVINKFRRAPRKSDAEAYARAFAAAQLNRLTASWQATAQRIDDELRADLDALRSRSRDLENNNDYARRYLEMVETNVVGHTGPRLISRVKNPNGTPDTLAARVFTVECSVYPEAIRQFAEDRQLHQTG